MHLGWQMLDQKGEGCVNRFGINHVMVGPINKTLDLVVTLKAGAQDTKTRRTFVDLAHVYGVVLTDEERETLAALPMLFEDLKEDVAEVAVALESKACMTEHARSLHRLHRETFATGCLVRSATPVCIIGLYALVNAAPTFASARGSSGEPNKHKESDITKVW